MSAKFYECESCKSIFTELAVKGEKGKACEAHLKEIKPGAVDAAKEKHVPVIEKQGNKVTVFIGEVEHPMIAEHYIEWIAIETKHGMQVKYLKPGDTPEAEFILTEDDKVKTAYEYCNIHGLWKKEA